MALQCRDNQISLQVLANICQLTTEQWHDTQMIASSDDGTRSSDAAHLQPQHT